MLSGLAKRMPVNLASTCDDDHVEGAKSSLGSRCTWVRIQEAL